MSSTVSLRKESEVHKVSGSSPPPPRAAPPPASPSIPGQVLSSPSVAVQLPPANSSFDKSCAPSQAPPEIRGSYDHLPYDQLHELCDIRGCSPKYSKEALETRLASMRGWIRIV